MASKYRHQHLKPAMLLTLLLVLSLPTAAIPVRPDPAVAFLLRIKSDYLVDPAGRLSGWTAASASPCNWTGVVCDPSSRAVVAVHLPGLGLAGGFPAAFCRVPSLRSLSLADNNLNGTLSAGAISACSRLRSLNLSSNCFIGDVPEFEPEFADLRVLDLSFNNLSGRIPASFGRFPALQVLNLFSNLLTGVIPAFLANLTELTQFNLAYNSFDPGPLPPELGNLTKLESIWLPFANLNGNIPDSIGNLARLRNLDLSDNELTGRIPASIGGLRSVEQIELYHNRLSGELPESLGELTALLEFDASENNLSGRLPEKFAGLRLKSLGLNDNQFEGDIPAVLALNPNLVELKLFNNNFSGEIPTELGQHCELDYFDIAGNGFVGHLPPNLCAGRKLRRLVAFDNQLSGGIPERYGDCSSLSYVRIQNNQLSGEIPESFWSLPKVYHLELRRNRFEGALPPAISSARNLTKLLISSNNFSGPITPSICDLAGLTIIDAGSNNFSGNLPPCFAGLPNVQILNLQSNKLSGQIPAGSWPYLVELDLSSNKLSDNIPASLGDLPVLTYLDLSDNFLSGEIPRELSNLKLNVLNLSGNHLAGEIPAGFDTDFYLPSLLRNPGLCSPSRLPPFPPCSADTRTRTVTVFLAVAAGLLAFGLVLFSGLIWFHLKRFKEPCEPEPGSIWKLTYSFDQIMFDESEILGCLKEANLIGSGGSGRVYRVRLASGQVVAVKKIRVDADGPEKDRAFRNEVETLGRVRHANIVRLLFCCAGSEYRLLVYEYMENGSLEAFLHGVGGSGGKEQQLDERSKDWGRRAKIAIGAARGLAYLHHDCVPAVVHRDVKPSNILLDGELEARVGDFGLARALPAAKSGEEEGGEGHLVMTNVAGSCGYIAPEYAYTLRVNEKSDVYSFGIVLLELVTGKRAIDDVCFGENKDIVRWVSEQVASTEGTAGRRDGLRFLVDPRLHHVSSSQYEEVVRFLHVALLCTSTFPMNRPSMRRVVEMLRDPKCHPPPVQIDAMQ